jgi:hypothetical protein
MSFTCCTDGVPVSVPTPGITPASVSKSGERYLPKAIVPTAPAVPGSPARPFVPSGTEPVTKLPGCDGSVRTWRPNVMPVTPVSGKTVRSPPWPSWNSAGARVVWSSWSRIFSITAVALSVVNRLAAATWPGGIPVSFSWSRAERSAFR